MQSPMRLPPRSEPEPDLLVARRRRDRYSSAHPTAEDALLVIEVADSSLHTERAVGRGGTLTPRERPDVAIDVDTVLGY